MRYPGLLMAVLLVGRAAGSEGPEAAGGRQGAVREAVSDDGRAAPETVTAALTEVFNRFGEVAVAVNQVQLSPDGAEGRGRMGKMAIPLIIGFKVAGAIVAAIAALKVLVMKTVALSSMALLASAAIAGKYIFDKVQAGKQHDLLGAAATPYYYAPVQEMAWDTSYDVQAAHGDLTVAHQPAPDLQGHYSSQIVQTSPINQTSYHPVQPAFTYIPGVPAVQRKILRGSTPHQTVYKTIHRISN